MTKDITQTLRPHFKDELTASENTLGQTANQEKAVEDNITTMGLIHLVVQLAPLLIKIEQIV